MVIPTSFELLYLNYYFTWVGFIDIRMLILTRVFCVLLYARVRLSGSAFETHHWSWSFAWRSSYLSSFQRFSWFQWCILIHVFDYCIRDFCCNLFNSVIYIVASWTTIFCFRCILLLCVCVSVTIYLLYIWALPNLN